MQIAIIGNGKMGRWFAEYFRRNGVLVSLYGRDDSLEDLYHAEYVMLAVSLGSMNEAIERIKKYIHKDQIVFDIGSTKSHFIKKLKKLKCRIGSVHPLFGAGAKSLKRQNVIVISDIGKEQKEIRHLFKESKIFEMTYKNHDRTMAYTQVLPYFINLLFGRVIKGKELPISPIYKMQTEIYEKILSEEAMVRQIIKLNPYSKEIIKELAVALKKEIEI